MTVRFIESAETELDEAIAYYDSKDLGLGSAFLLEVLTATDRISRYPDAWQHLDKDIRRCRLARFPYGLIYAEEAGDILILAVAHLHRKPDYWRDRNG